MPSWNEILTQVESKTPEEGLAWLASQLTSALQQISALRNNRNVIFYASAFLQKPLAEHHTLLTYEEINGFMSVMFGMDTDRGWKKGLTLLLHTPGGSPNAADTVIAYLREKFPYIEVIVPTYAMSAGTMIALAADRIVMGRQSQLGPIDPQMPIGGSYYSAQSVVDLFETARRDILPENQPENLSAAHVWAPVLQSMGPALLQEAKNALAYGEQLVEKWLACGMFRRRKNQANDFAKKAAAHFNSAAKHKSHGRRIDREEARGLGLRIEDLEKVQLLQDAVLTAYHVVTILFEKTPATKLLFSHAGKAWLKNIAQAQEPLDFAARSEAT